MDTLANLGLGFSVALEPTNLLFCFIGVFVGTFIGVLPGLGPIAAIALLLPLTFKMAPATAIIMLAGIYYGAMYGGSTTSILVNIPGEAASVVTCLDGYQMARQGRAGPALGIAALGSFIAGTFGLVGLMFFAPVLGAAALRFGPPEYFALTFLGLTLISYLSRGSMLKALLMAIFGLLLGTIGTDPISGQERFTYGSLTLGDGLGLVPVAMGVFGIAEVLDNLGKNLRGDVYEKDHQGTAAQPKGLAGELLAHCQRVHRRFFHRHPSRTERRHVLLRLLCDGKASLAPSRKVRHRRYRGSRRTGISQQLRHRRRLYPAPFARIPV